MAGIKISSGCQCCTYLLVQLIICHCNVMFVLILFNYLYKVASVVQIQRGYKFFLDAFIPIIRTST